VEAEASFQAPPPAQPYGEVFDRGYQHYTGPRLGRQHAVKALIWYSMKRGLGVKKRWTAKIIPFILYVGAFAPAIIVVALLAFLESNVPGEDSIDFGYADLNGFTAFILLVFAAACAPEMLCDDRRENVLSLYFSRAITRLDYLVAKVAALSALMGTIAFGPALLLFIGKNFLEDNPFSAFIDNIDDLGRIIVFGTLVSIYWAAIGLSIASFTNRKGVAAAIFIGGVFIITGLSNALYEALDSSARRFLIVLAPLDLLVAISQWLFGGSDSEAGLSEVDVSALVLIAGVIGAAAICGLIMYRRYLADE
jgi:ABC-2 type transport system permease protein